MKTVFVIAIAFLCAVVPARADPAGRATPYQGEYDPANIVIVVESQGGHVQRHARVGMSCDGSIVIAGAYADSTKVRATTSPDSVLALVNDLLALDFFGLKAEYPYERGKAVRQPNGRIGITQETAIDNSARVITLHLGGTSHSVRLWLPARGAPEALGPWLDRFRALVTSEVDWFQFW